MRRSPFYYLHVQAGAVMSENTPWCTAKRYTNVAEEHMAVREAIGVTDWSTMGKFDIKGPDSKAFIQNLIVNDVNKLTPNKALYSCMANENGGMFDDTTVYMFSEEHFMLVGSTGGRLKDRTWFKKHQDGRKVYITDITGGLGLLSVQGPKSRDMLNTICTPGLSDLKYFEFLTGKIGDVDVLVSRTGFTGELGFEIYAEAESCAELWNSVTVAGKPFGLRLVGLDAASGTVRLEKGYIGGKEYNETINPYEAGLGWTVCLDKGDFVGSDALRRIKAEGPKKRLVGLQLEDPAVIAASGAEILLGGESVGQITSGGFSHTFGKSIALGYVKTDIAVIGTEVTVNTGGRQVKAVIGNKTLYDPECRRLKA